MHTVSASGPGFLRLKTSESSAPDVAENMDLAAAFGECNDGLDNDSDALVDADDPGCLDALDARESPGGPRRCGLGFEVMLALPILIGLRRRRTRFGFAP